jgi:hypothetical protein
MRTKAQKVARFSGHLAIMKVIENVACRGYFW